MSPRTCCFSLAIVSALALGTTACSSSSSPAGTTTTGSTTSTGGGGATGAGGGQTTGAGGHAGGGGAGGGAGVTCAGPGHSGNPTSQDVGKVTVSLVDLDLKPAAGVEVFVCGIDLCTNPKTTDASGNALLDATGLPMKQAAFKFGDSWQWGKFAAPLKKGQTNFTFANAIVPALPATGATLSPGTPATSGGATLTVEAQGSVTFDELIFETPEMQQFRAVRIPPGKEPPGVDASLSLEILYAAGPISTVLCPAAKLSVPNDTSWAAGTAVELYVHGADGASQEWTPYAGWTKVGDGAVSADGKTVETTKGSGLPVIGAFGFRKK